MQCMRLVTMAAIAVLFFGATREATHSRRAGCMFNIPLNALQCARLREAAHRATGRSWLSSDAKETLVYSSQTYSDSVTISAAGRRGFKTVGSLALPSGSAPLGLTVDEAQNLYVAISPLGSGTASVEVFPRGATTPSKVYTEGLSGAEDVAVDKNGTLYVANLADPSGGGCSQGNGLGGSVVEYAAGSMTPTATISDFPGCPNGVAVDSSANLYLTYLYYSSSGLPQSDVREYTTGSTKGRALGLRARGGLDLGGIAIAPNGDIVVENGQADGTFNQLLTFPQGKKRPSNVIQYGGEGWGVGFKFFALLGGKLFAPAYVAETFSYVVTTPGAFDYPSGSQLFAENPALTSLPFAYGFAASPGS